MDIRCAKCGGVAESKSWKSWAEQKDKVHFYWRCIDCKHLFRTRRGDMVFSEQELDALKWAVHAATDRLKRVVEAVREEKGLTPTQELVEHISRLEGLIERFGPMEMSYHI